MNKYKTNGGRGVGGLGHGGSFLFDNSQDYYTVTSTGKSKHRPSMSEKFTNKY